MAGRRGDTAQRSRPTADTRPDASMMLLTDIFAQPIDPGYQEAAERRAERAERRAEQGGDGAAGEDDDGVSRRPAALVLAGLAIGSLLALGLSSVRDDAAVVSEERAELIDRITLAQADVTDASSRVESLEDEVGVLQQSQLDQVAGQADFQQRTENLRSQVGVEAVTGPGVRITLTDAADGRAPGATGTGVILDLDLQQALNGLWAAGAEAISINGERVTPLTAVRAGGGVPLVNYQPLQPPYEVSAIGDQRALASRFNEGPGGQWLRAAASVSGIGYTIDNVDDLTLPAGNASLRFVDEEGAL